MTGRGPRRERRNHRIPIRLTSQELAVARQRAHATGRPLARYLRELALGGSPRTLRLQPRNDIIDAIGSIIRDLDDDARADAAVVKAATALRALLTRLTT